MRKLIFLLALALCLGLAGTALAWADVNFNKDGAAAIVDGPVKKGDDVVYEDEVPTGMHSC